MKKGAALSLVLAPGGTTMFWVTQAGCARAAGISDTAEIIAAARAANMLLIFVSLNRRVLLARLHGKYEERSASGQVATAHAVSIERCYFVNNAKSCRVGKGALAPCPPSIVEHHLEWWARSALPTLRLWFTWSAARRRRSSHPAADFRDSRGCGLRRDCRSAPANSPRRFCGRVRWPRARLPSRGCGSRRAFRWSGCASAGSGRTARCPR